MRKLAWIAIGAMGLLMLVASAAVLFLRASGGLSTRSEPSGPEAWLARSARKLAMPAEAQKLQNPVPKTPEILAEGLAHWADRCAGCHANDGSGDTAMGKGLYPPAPDMRQRATQDLTDGELFYVIENGIRLTGMPAWGGPGHDGTASWKLVHFIRHLPSVTFEERREMERLNPKGPDEIEEQREQEEFLKGESDHEVHTHKH